MTTVTIEPVEYLVVIRLGSEAVDVSPPGGVAIMGAPDAPQVVIRAAAQGEQGEPGPAGADFVPIAQSWSPPSPQTTWSINHQMGRYPLVIVQDSAGEQFVPDLRHIDINNLEIRFAVPATGTAILT